LKLIIQRTVSFKNPTFYPLNYGAKGRKINP